MSWSKPATPTRRNVFCGLGTILLATAGCGFTPVYAPGSSGSTLEGAVTVAVGGGIYGFSLGQALQNRLGPPVDPRYRLTYSLSTSSERVAVTTAQSTNRFNLIGRSNYQLVDQTSGSVVTSGQVDGFSSYSALGTSVATRAAQRDGYERLAVILADKIVARLLAVQGLAQ